MFRTIDIRCLRGDTEVQCSAMNSVTGTGHSGAASTAASCQGSLVRAPFIRGNVQDNLADLPSTPDAMLRINRS